MLAPGKNQNQFKTFCVLYVHRTSKPRYFLFVNNEEKIISKHFSGTRCVFSKQFEADNGGVFEMLDI